ncbi:3603_t:CDS:2, partial [Ambispora gerdemannii]
MGNTKNSCSELIAQLRNYKLHESPYNTPYLEGTDTPLKWWNTCFATQSQLQDFAIKLFSITPHAASCERVWSSVGWIYELHYSQPSISNDKIIELVKESLSEGYEESFEEDEGIVLSNLHEPE